MRSTIMPIIVLLIAAIIAVFAGQNVQIVTVRFLGWSVETSLVVVIVFSAAAGGVLVGVISLWRQLQSGLRQRGLSGQLSRAQSENEELRAENEDLRNRVTTLEGVVRKLSVVESETEESDEDADDTDEESEEKPSSFGV
ncbi:MAG: LapA family protein [Bacillota bacterium]